MTEMKNNVDQLRKRILPILLYCQANKGDLWLYDSWKSQKDAGKKFFYAYYAGLFCRILLMLEDESNVRLDSVVSECNLLLDKYNWYEIQKQDLELCCAGSTYDCEVQEALAFIDGVDNVAWENSGFRNGRDAVCLKTPKGSFTFADVRGSIKP